MPGGHHNCRKKENERKHVRSPDRRESLPQQPGENHCAESNDVTTEGVFEARKSHRMLLGDHADGGEKIDYVVKHGVRTFPGNCSQSTGGKRFGNDSGKCIPNESEAPTAVSRSPRLKSEL